MWKGSSVLFQQEECVEACCNAYEKHWWLHGAIGTEDSKQQVWFVTCITAKHAPIPINSVSCHTFQPELCLFNTGMLICLEYSQLYFPRIRGSPLWEAAIAGLAARSGFPAGTSPVQVPWQLTKIARKEAFEAIPCEKVVRTSRAVCVSKVWAVCQKCRVSALVGRRRWTAWNETKLSIH